MKLLIKMKEKFLDIIKRNLVLNLEIFMENGSSLVCKDKLGIINKAVKIVATHVNLESDNPIDFPQFDIVRSTSKDGYLSFTNKNVLTLDVDENPTEGSKKLLTSGQLYNIINDLLELINQLKNLITK